MGIQDLVPANTTKAKSTAIKAFTRFVTEENVTMEYIQSQFALDTTGVLMERVLDKFGSYLAFLDTKNGKQLARNTVIPIIVAKLLKMGTTLDRYCMKRDKGGFVKKAVACTKDHLRTLMVHQYSTAKNATDYQDAALLCLLWYLFGRASDLSSLRKTNLTVSAGGVLFVRLMRMKTSEEQGLSLYYDENYLACPITSIAAAFVMQTTPDVALLGHLPDSQDQIQLDSVPSMPLMDLLNGSLGADSSSAPKADVEVKKSVTQLTALPGVHSHINRLLNRISKPAGVEAELTSHSFRRGGAQHANSSAELSPQWIFDRGSWNMTVTNKAFAYVFNTSNEDQKVVRVLSSWPASASVMGPTLDALYAAIRVDVSRLQERLFTACVGMQEKKFNINGEVTTFLMGYLLRSYPMFKALCS
ncbi:hypothetical protein LEN26_014178, partial [Aphanomyces euteiches]